VDQILLGSKISFRRLHRRVAQEQLDLLKLSARGPAEFRAVESARTQRMGADPWQTRGTTNRKRFQEQCAALEKKFG
jgi:hypothetical protein